MEKLRKGEIDLLGMAEYTEERARDFLYSELPMADDYTAVIAAANSDTYYQDYSTFSGCRVGVTRGTSYEQIFAEYAQTRGLDYEFVYFDNADMAEEALEEGSTDLLVLSGLWSSGHKLVDRFALKPVYFITSRENQALMDELNTVVQRVRIEEQDFESDLRARHFSTNAVRTSLNLTREEQEYINSVGPITIRSFAGHRPLGYVVAGKYRGILADYLDMIGSVSGLEFKYEVMPESSLRKNIMELLDQRSVLLFTELDTAKLGLTSPVYRSDIILESPSFYVSRKNSSTAYSQVHQTVALNNEMFYLESVLLTMHPNYIISYYHSSEACIKAVIEGEADLTVQDEHIIHYFMQKPEYADHLMEIEGGVKLSPIRLYAPEYHQHLISIINKTLRALSDQQKEGWISHTVLRHPYVYTFDDVMYVYGSSIAIGIAIFLLAIVISYHIVHLYREKKKAVELREKLKSDPLTGVYNREAFLQKAQETLRNSDDNMYIVRLDVRNFKLINELYGAEKGDEVLRHIGHELERLSSQEYFIAGRFTGDHFYLCIPRSVFESLPFPHQISTPGISMDVTTNYGVYPVGTQKALPVDIMCGRANMAIVAGRSSGDYICFYNEENRRHMLREQELDRAKEDAITERQFCIHIQPKYDVDAGTLSGGEVLVRWRHPEWGMVSPGEFVPIFERSGFIRELDYFVWEECCAFIRRTKDKGLSIPPISINISRIHFYSAGLQEKLESLLQKYALMPEEVDLELTETIYAEDPDVIIKKCEALRRSGFKIAMDDFGSGYSSLNMLKKMPLDVLKMDLRFLLEDQDLDEQKRGHDILYSLVEMAKRLNLLIVVEGVETVEQRDSIHEFGSCQAQGYYYSRPLPLDEFEKLLTSAQNGKENCQ